jgi:hypothetical protein
MSEEEEEEEETKSIILCIPEILYWYKFYHDFQRLEDATHDLLSSEVKFNNRTARQVRNSLLCDKKIERIYIDRRYNGPKNYPICMLEALDELDYLDGLILKYYDDLRSEGLSDLYTFISSSFKRVCKYVKLVDEKVAEAELAKQVVTKTGGPPWREVRIVHESIVKPYLVPSDVVSPIGIIKTTEGKWLFQIKTSGKFTEYDLDDTPRWIGFVPHNRYSISVSDERVLNGDTPLRILPVETEQIGRMMMYRRKQRQDKMKLNLFPTLPDPVAQLILEFAGHAREKDIYHKN